MPLLSIVMANYNYGRFLEEAIQSVLAQTCHDLELIIVDGGSTDNSVDIIRKFESRLAWWCSEKDRGQSHAFNKGFAQASGRFMTWLNADDILFPGAVEALRQAVQAKPDCRWFAGGCFWLDPALKVIKCSRARPFSKLAASRRIIPVWGPSSFFAKTLLDQVGGVDENFHYMMDTELWNRFYHRAGETYEPLPVYCWGLRLHPDAKMSGHNFAASSHVDKSHPKWEQMRREGETFAARYPLSPPTPLLRVRSVSLPHYLMSRVDTFRYKGKPASRIFAGKGAP